MDTRRIIAGKIKDALHDAETLTGCIRGAKTWAIDPELIETIGPDATTTRMLCQIEQFRAALAMCDDILTGESDRLARLICEDQR